jgi:hypothetical protein
VRLVNLGTQTKSSGDLGVKATLYILDSIGQWNIWSFHYDIHDGRESGLLLSLTHFDSE